MNIRGRISQLERLSQTSALESDTWPTEAARLERVIRTFRLQRRDEEPRHPQRGSDCIIGLIAEAQSFRDEAQAVPETLDMEIENRRALLPHIVRFAEREIATVVAGRKDVR